MPDREEFGDSGDSQVRILKSLKNTELELSVVLMEKDFPIGQLMTLSPGSVIPFECSTSEPAILAVNGEAFAKGKVVQMNEYYGLEVKDVLVGSSSEG